MKAILRAIVDRLVEYSGWSLGGLLGAPRPNDNLRTRDVEF